MITQIGRPPTPTPRTGTVVSSLDVPFGPFASAMLPVELPGGRTLVDAKVWRPLAVAVAPAGPGPGGAAPGVLVAVDEDALSAFALAAGRHRPDPCDAVLAGPWELPWHLAERLQVSLDEVLVGVVDRRWGNVFLYALVLPAALLAQRPVGVEVHGAGTLAVVDRGGHSVPPPVTSDAFGPLRCSTTVTEKLWADLRQRRTRAADPECEFERDPADC